MNKNVSLICLVICFFLFACKKENKVFSTWSVNGKEYSSSDVIASVGKAIAILGSNDISNRFSLTFYLDYLPTDDPKTQ